MLIEYIVKAIKLGADSVEIEYRDGKEWITAFKDFMGFGIGTIDSEYSEALVEEIDELKRKKLVKFEGDTYRLSFSKHESFGEWVYRLNWKKTKDRTNQSS